MSVQLPTAAVFCPLLSTPLPGLGLGRNSGGLAARSPGLRVQLYLWDGKGLRDSLICPLDTGNLTRRSACTCWSALRFCNAYSPTTTVSDCRCRW